MFHGFNVSTFVFPMRRHAHNMSLHSMITHGTLLWYFSSCSVTFIQRITMPIISVEAICPFVVLDRPAAPPNRGVLWLLGCLCCVTTCNYRGLKVLALCCDAHACNARYSWRDWSSMQCQSDIHCFGSPSEQLQGSEYLSMHIFVVSRTCSLTHMFAHSRPIFSTPVLWLHTQAYTDTK